MGDVILYRRIAVYIKASWLVRSFGSPYDHRMSFPVNLP